MGDSTTQQPVPMATDQNLPRRRFLQGCASMAAILASGACGTDGAAPPSGGTNPLPPPTPSPTPTRSWKLGFSPTPPQPTVAAVLAGIDRWSQRSELAIIHEELPWADLLAGQTPQAILQRDKVELVALLRSKGLALTFMLDLTNGLDRAAEAPSLVAAGRSLAEPAVQVLAVDYALAVETVLRPDRLGVAAETNLVRSIAPPQIYAALRETAQRIETALSGAAARSQRFISVQVERAWGGLGGNGTFTSIDQDIADFPFTQALGLSSYPYFLWTQPEDIPANYYSRIKGNRNLPVLVTEGGWTSASLAGSTIQSTPEKQARYIAKHAELLDSVAAAACFQLMFADLDLASLPAPVPPSLPLFAELGLTDKAFAAKPALAAWDALFARSLA